MKKPGKVGDLLIHEGLIDAPALARGLEVQAKNGGSLGKALAGLGLADEDAVSAAIARGMRLDHLDSEFSKVPPEVAALIPLDYCRKRLVAPLELQGNSLRLALCDPLDYSTLQDVVFLTGKKVVAVVAGETAILGLLDHLQPKANDYQEAYNLLANIDPEGEVEKTEEDSDETSSAVQPGEDTNLPPVIRLVNLILSDAAKAKASDVHIEPNEFGLLVRHRVDGMLHDVLKIPQHLQDATISRLKIISRMDIADRRRPQDGRCRLRLNHKRLDLRVSTLPTQFGEKVVIRLLDNSKAQLPMDQLDLSPENLVLFQASLSRPLGMILVTGPTGSGKTSTLYTSINWVNSPTNNIITVEDPIEIQLPGVSQVQINIKAGMTFASGLRSILRQDPDVILVGEIRDSETATIAAEAAQTGHLLLSTLHTNDAPSTISRLMDLGLEPFQLASVLLAILAQRLVRRVCANCAEPRLPEPDAIERVGGASLLPPEAHWMAGKGCARCGQSGYKGRLAVHELLQMTDELRGLVARRAPDYEIRKAARSAGMKTLMEDGIAKAARGLTTLEEVARVIAKDDAASPPVDRRAAPVESASPEPSLAGERILTVEDSPTVVTVLKYFLELDGFQVLVAENGAEGLEMARREHPRVILSDVNMPGMDGVAMVKALRADPQTRDVAIMMLTSESSVESETEGLAAGADDYILKPVEPRRLAARVKALFMRLQARKASSSADAATPPHSGQSHDPGMAA